MTSIELDMIQTAGIGALALIVGMVLTRKVAFLQKYCVPSPVVTFPTYFGALILAAIVRNTIGFVSYKENGIKVKADKLLDMERIVSVGNICLSMFLGMAMISLKLWELQNLALPLIVVLVTQVALMDFFAYFVAFPHCPHHWRHVR